MKDFRTQLAKLIPLITTTAQTISDREKLAQNKKEAAEKKYRPPLVKMSGVNLTFSHKGLVQVSYVTEFINKQA